MMRSTQENTEISDYFCFDEKMTETEIEFSDFYENIMKSLYDIGNIRLGGIRQSLGNIRSHKNPDVNIHKTVDFEEESYRCAYVFAYSILHSIVMYDRFSDMLKHNPNKLKRIESMKKLKLCILGGGPAFEVAAICKLLSTVLGQRKRPPLQLRVTVIDICANWETEAKSISSAHNTLCTGIDMHFSFIKADVTEGFSTDVLKAFENAHFVTMFKFASEINGIYGEKKMFGVIHKIIDVMSYKSCLFVLDISGGGVFKKVDRMLDSLLSTSRIYGPSLYYCCRLSPETIETFSAKLNGIFKVLKCTAQTTVSCSAWMNVDKIVNLEELSSGVYVDTPASVLQDLERHKCKGKHSKTKIKNSKC